MGSSKCDFFMSPNPNILEENVLDRPTSNDATAMKDPQTSMPANTTSERSNDLAQSDLNNAPYGDVIIAFQQTDKTDYQQ